MENPQRAQRVHKPITADVILAFAGSLTLLTPLTSYGREWVEESLQTEPWQWLGSTVTIDHRMGVDIRQAMIDDGLTVEIDTD